MDRKQANDGSQAASSERIAKIIFEHAAVISMQRDVGTLLQLNADMARDLLGAERCSVWLADEGAGELWTKVAHGIDEIRIPIASGLAGACFLSNTTMIVNDVQADPRFNRAIDAASGYGSRSAICVPLRVADATIGVLQVLNKPEGFTEEDAEVLRLMSLYSASAIQSERLRQITESARLLRRELDVAAAVQQRLLPQRRSNLGGLEYLGFCRPASSVGGDFYDLLELDDGSLGITLGDVAGKGFPAAVLMASIHTLLRHLLMHDSSNLSQTMTELNKTVYLSSAAERYATLFCGVVSPDRKTLRFVNAGHVPPFVLRPSNGEVDSELDGEMPLGLMSSTQYTEYKLRIEPGDVFVCVSDGIVEAEDKDGNYFDFAMLNELLLQLKNQSVTTIVNRMITAIDAFVASASQADDMTVVAFRVLPAAD